MPIAVANPTKGRVTSGGAAVTGNVTSAASGSTFIIATMSGSGATFTSVSDSKSNTYTQIASEVTGSGLKARLYYRENGTGGATHNFTGTWSVGAATALALEITGGKLIGILDPTPPAGISDVSSPFASNNITTNQANVLLVAFIAGDSGSNPATHAESSGFTIQAGAEETDGTQYWVGCLATRIVSSTGTYSSSFTQAGSSGAIVFIAAFEEADAPFNVNLAWIRA